MLQSTDLRDRERRSPHGDHFLRQLAQQPASFSELADAARETTARISDVIDWITRAVHSGIVEYEDHGGLGKPGPRRVRLTERGYRIAAGSRRARMRGVA